MKTINNFRNIFQLIRVLKIKFPAINCFEYKHCDGEKYKYEILSGNGKICIATDLAYHLGQAYPELLNIFYESWSRSKIYIDPEKNPAACLLKSICRDEIFFYYASLFKLPISASIISSIITDYFNLSVGVKTVEFKKYYIDENHKTTLLNKNNKLGVNSLLGEYFFMQSKKHEILLFADSYSKYLELHPRKLLMKTIESLVAKLANDNFCYEILVVMHGFVLPKYKLRENSNEELGFNVWI